MPYTKEAIHFLYAYNKIGINKNDGSIHIIDSLERQSEVLEDPETLECLKKSKILGEMFATANDSNSIFESFNLKPF